MRHDQSASAPYGDAARIARDFPSYRDFVDDALFDPVWGYYSTGTVRFGDGGHFDTYPLALSPLFGRMLAEYAYRSWRRGGAPSLFEICELGAGNGQLCADTILWVTERSRHEPAWRRFADAMRYRIVERSPALLARQRETLGPLSDSVVWTKADLGASAPRQRPFAQTGLVIANEVLDCLAHHKVVPLADGTPGVVFVVPTLSPARGGGAPRPVPRSELAEMMARRPTRERLRFDEVVLPIRKVPPLSRFLRRHYPELFSRPWRDACYFACPTIERVVRNTAQLYRHVEVLWIDYGGKRAFHLEAPAARRVFAGPPRSGHTIYDNPGRDDITFMVDFSVVARAAEDAGLSVAFYGPQAELARRSGVALDRRAIDLIVRGRALGWLLAVMGLGPERQWRRAGLSWDGSTLGREPVRQYVKRSVGEFLGKYPTDFKLMILRHRAAR